MKRLVKRILSWPEDAQDELATVAGQIEEALRTRDYLAENDELLTLNVAMAVRDGGEVASDGTSRTLWPISLPREIDIRM